MDSAEELLERYENSVIANLNKDNFKKIISFLIKEQCDYIEDIIDDYLDLFNFPYEEFVKKYHILNQKYDGKFLEEASEDMNLLEEFYRE